MKAPRSRRRKLFRILIGLVLLPVVLLLLAMVLIYLPPVQNAVRTKAVSFLEAKTGTTVRLDHLNLRFPLGVTLEGLFVADEQGDTLLHAGTLKAQVGLRALFDKRILLKSVDLSDVRATMVQRPDSSFNFDFIIATFTKKDRAPAPVDTSAGFAFAIEEIELHDIVFDMDMQPSGLAMDVRLGALSLDLDLFQLKPMRFHVDEFVLANTTVDMRTSLGEPRASSYPELVNPLARLDVRFNTVELDNVAFTMNTVDTGDSLWVAVKSATITSRDMDLTRQWLALEEMDVDGVRFGMVSEPRAPTIDTTTVDPPWLDQHDGFRYWTKDWDIVIDELHLANSDLALHVNEIKSPALLFDPEHVAFEHIEMNVEGLVLNNQRIAVVLKSMALHGGPENMHMQTSLELDATPAEISVKKGSLEALGVAMSFNAGAKPGDLAAVHRAPYEVPVSLEVETALRSSDLVRFLGQIGVDLPAAIASNEHLDVNASFRGTAQRADQLALDLTGDEGSRLKVRGNMQAIDQWPRSTFAITLDQLVMGSGVEQVMRAYMPSDMTVPQRLSVQGAASGSGGTLRGALVLDSDLGRVVGSAKVKGWNGGLPDDLDLEVDIAALDLASIIGDTAFDPVSLKVSAVGGRLNSPTRAGSLSVVPSALTHSGNDLSSLALHAIATGDSIAIDLGSKAAAADFQLKGKGRWPGKGDSLALDLDLALGKLEFKDLGITDHVLNTDGHMVGRIAFSTEGFGRVRLNSESLRLFNASTEFRFERFALNGLLATDSTAVDLDSDAITVAYHTNMRADSLLPNARSRVARFFQKDSTFIPVPGRHAEFAVTLPRTEWLTDLVVPDLEAIELRELHGRYDGDLQQFELVVDLPHLDYAGVDVHELVVNLDALGDRLNGALNVARVQRDSLYIENLHLDAVNAEGGIDATLRIRHGERDRYRIGASFRREDGARVLRLGGDLVLNYNTWIAHPENALRSSDARLRAEHFELSSGAERMSLRTDERHNTIELTAFQLTTLTSVISAIDSVPLVSGAVDGRVRLPVVDAARLHADMTIADLRAMGVDIGTLSLQTTEVDVDRYQADVVLQHQANHLTANALADLSTTTPHVQVDADLAFDDLSFLEPFVADYLYAVDGGLDGDLHYRKSGQSVTVTGRTTFTDTRLGLIETGAIYRLPNETLQFMDQGIVLDNVSVLDSAGNRFRLDGKVLTAVGKVPALDLRLRTDRFQLVNSTIEQNPMFFGVLFSSIDLRIDGTVITPRVHGDVGVLDGTALSVVLPGSRVELVEHGGIVVFTTEADPLDSASMGTDSEMLRDSLAAQLPGVDLDLHILLDKRAQFAVVIDPTTGDQATFSGEADLMFRYAPDGDMYLSGPFTVKDGGYTLAFYGMVKKRFELVPGGTVVWSGDPLGGIMDVQAKYRSDSAPYPLVANARGGGISESERNQLQTRLPFDVLINIREEINAPSINFGLDLDRLHRNNYQQVSNRLDQLAQPANQEELNRQVFGLLVLNTFIEDAPPTDQPGSNLASTAARNSVNSILTDQLNGLTGQRIKGMDVQLGVNTYEQTEGGDAYQRTTVDYKVTQRVLNDRVRIEAGGSIGANEKNQTVSGVTNNRAAQYAISYDLTPDGRLRVRAFHENAYDLYDGELINNGLAFTITREFEQDGKERERRRAEIKKQREAILPKED